MKTGNGGLLLAAIVLQLILLGLAFVNPDFQNDAVTGSGLLWLGSAVIARGLHPFRWHWREVWGSWRK